MPSNKIKVAIDGPAGAGKSTVARLVAGKLGYIYVDTGAMYRAVTWYVLHEGISPLDTDRIASSLSGLDLKLKPSDAGQQVWLGGLEVTGMIRSPEVTGQVSQIAQIPQVRAYLTGIQKRMSAEGGIVMDGRDIGTQVLPDAELKIFLTASVEERADRRYRELQSAGAATMTIDELKRDIEERDRMDAERKVSPLRQAEDAVYLDCTTMSIDQVVDRIVQLSMSIMNGSDGSR